MTIVLNASLGEDSNCYKAKLSLEKLSRIKKVERQNIILYQA